MTTDRNAFIKIKFRLEQDVGGIIELIQEKQNKEDYIPPFYAFLRMLFPVVESIGYLLYGKNSGNVLVKLLENDLSKYNSNYYKIAAILVLLYRHSLMHQDELRSILYDNFPPIRWAVGYVGSTQRGIKHLEILNLDHKEPLFIVIQFDITNFYQDIVKFLEEKISSNTISDDNGDIGQRYDNWSRYILHKNCNKISFIEQKAIEEIKELVKGK